MNIRKAAGPSGVEAAILSMSSKAAMRSLFAALFAAALSLCAIAPAKAQTFTLSNIQYWVGTGTNQCALVISWNDGVTPDNLVFGYNWDMPASGTAPTLYDMLASIQTADPLLQITADPAYDSPSTGDYAVYSAFYNLTGGAGPTVGTPGNLGGSEDGSAPAGDHYAEGWYYNGFWGELIAEGDPYDGGSWDSYDAEGVAVDTLSNDAWFGLSFSTDLTNYTVPNPGTPSAVFPTPVPEPACLWLLAGTGLLGALRWKRRVP
ncbi:MAG TPA: PEP-CTERM sorting domain-containing protein [Chthoniobacteraceae bacterium]|jgi:hypothetical protein|nr:PEP-CTERM sorting domain-containing protein [Chthoniobacteraceae bacterium]